MLLSQETAKGTEDIVDISVQSPDQQNLGLNERFSSYCRYALWCGEK